MSSNTLSRLLSATAIAVALAAMPAAHAVNITWDGSDSTAWATGANWVGNTAPANATTPDTAIFTGDPTGVNQPHIGSGRSVQGVTFSSAGWTIGSNSGSELILGSTGMDSSGAGTNKVNTGKLRAQGGIWNIAGGNTLEINAAVTWQTGTTTFSGNGSTPAGTVVFNATAASNAGQLEFKTSGGVPTVHLGANDALGTGSVNVPNGTTFRAINGPRSLNNAITFHQVTMTLSGNDFTLKKKLSLGGGGSSSELRMLSVGTGLRATANVGLDTIGRTFSKEGSGTLVLQGTSNLDWESSTGNNGSQIKVNGGTLLVNGAVAASSGQGGLITVAAGCTLGGTGSTSLLSGRTVTVNGTLAPGDPNSNGGAGQLTIGSESSSKTNNLTLGAGSNFAVQLNGAAAGTGYDQVKLFGNRTLSSTGTGVGLDVALGYDADVGDMFVILDHLGSGTTSGTFARLNDAAADLSEGASFHITEPVSGITCTFAISYVGGDGNDIVLTVTGKTGSGTVVLIR